MNLTAKIILILFGLAYLISPVDIIPDLALPFLGWIDDSLVLWCIYYLIRHGDLPWFMFKRPQNPGIFRGKGPDSRTRHGRGTRSKNRSRKDTGSGAHKDHQADAEPGASSRSGTRSGSGPGKRTEAAETETPSPYEVLGVEKTAPWKDIQKAYKEKIKQYHPDKLSHLGEEFSSLANEKFLEIQAAYDQLRAMRGR